MRKLYFFLLVVVCILAMVGCSDNSLNEAAKYGEEISNKVQTLYKERSDELSTNSNKFYAWRKEISNTSTDTSYTIERDEKGNWLYYTENYKRIPFEWKDNDFYKLIKALFEDYGVKNVTITDKAIRFYISEDALIYSTHYIVTDSQIIHIEGNWYHFRFPYGI